MTTIGFIGVGMIGMPMAKNILKGFGLTAYDLDAARVAEMVEAGARGARSIAEAVADADVVITMLPDAPDVERAAAEILPHIRKDAIYVDMSTIDPATTRRVGERFAARGCGDRAR